jgi:cytochrome c553
MRSARSVSARSHGVGPIRHFLFVLAAATVLTCWATAPALAQDAAVAAAKSAAAAADKALTKKCLDCHDDPKVKTKDGKSMQVVTDDFRRSAHRKVDCVACHEVGMASKHPDEPLGAGQAAGLPGMPRRRD